MLVSKDKQKEGRIFNFSTGRGEGGKREADSSASISTFRGEGLQMVNISNKYDLLLLVFRMLFFA